MHYSPHLYNFEGGNANIREELWQEGDLLNVARENHKKL